MNIQEKVFRTRPRWLDEEPAIIGLLDTFLHKLEKGHRLSMRVNAKTIPELFDFSSPDVKYLWSLVKSLNNEYHIVSIRYARNKPYQEPYDNAQLVFNPEREELVRDWLNRPALDPYALVWQDTLHKLKDHFEDHGQALAEQMVRLADKGPEQTLRAFARISTELQKPITLRALSARCFWGDSKFLDHREELVRELFPGASRNLQPRPILLAVHLSEKLERVLFVENQDSFLLLCQAQLNGITLIYSAGFRGSATRIRESGNAVFSFMNATTTQQTFEDWWYAADVEEGISVRFWGDLDFAGMAILKALKQTFPRIDAWKPGYNALLERLANAMGHDHESSGKERQKDPELTGCEFADLELLPAIRNTGQFVDQEAILSSEF